MWSVVMLGRGVGKREPALLPRSSFSALCCGSSSPPLAPWSPFQAPLSSPLSPCAFYAWICGPGHTSCLGYSCGFQLLKQLWWPPPKVAVDQQQMKPEGLFIAGWPWGLEQGLWPGEAQ